MNTIPLSIRQQLRKLGSDLRKARLRRGLKMVLVAERAGISRETLAKIQRGDPSVSMGSYASVVFALGLGTKWLDFADIGADPLGRILDEERLPERVR